MTALDFFIGIARCVIALGCLWLALCCFYMAYRYATAKCNFNGKWIIDP